MGVAAMAWLALVVGAPLGAPVSPQEASGLAAVWTPGPPPTGRFGHAAIQDPLADRILVFGGLDHDSVRSDLWEMPMGSSAAWQARVLLGSPPPRYLAASVYDPVRHRLVMFGGDGPSGTGNEVWALALDEPLAWAPLAVSGTPPAARWGASAIYDPAGDRMIVFGGRSTPHYNDVWQLSLSGTPTWTLLTPAGTPPAARCLHAACFDPVRGEMIVFGGESSPNSPRNDAWVLALSGAPAWTSLTAGVPPAARTGATLVFDPAGDRALLFGGLAGGNFSNDLWELPRSAGATWNALGPAGTPPPARDLHAAWFDASRQCMVLFGGRTIGFFNDTWTLSLSGPLAWNSVPLLPGGPARASHVAIYDPPRERMVVFGSSATDQVDVLALSGPWAWTTLATSGTSPGPRYAPMGVYDSNRERLLIFGGYAGPSLMNDVWSLPLAGPPVWAPIVPPGPWPLPRFAGVMVFDPIGDRVILFGGLEGTSRPNNVWELSLAGEPAWILRNPSGVPPAGLDHASAILDPVGNRMLVFGGYAGGVGPLRNQTWALSLDGPMSWSLLATTGKAPSPRYTHTAVYDSLRHRMVVFGGIAGTFSFPQETWALALDASLAWSQVPTLGTLPAGRRHHSAIWETRGDRMVIFGGSASDGVARNDAWTLQGEVEPDTSVTAVEPLRPKSRLDFGTPRPNPSSQSVTLDFSLPAAGGFVLGLHDLAGRRVREWKGAGLAPGPHSVVWDRRDARGMRVPPGLYLARLEALGATAVRKLVVVDPASAR